MRIDTKNTRLRQEINDVTLQLNLAWLYIYIYMKLGGFSNHFLSYA